MTEETQPATLLICTVGGSPEPIVKALVHWRPIKVWFIPTAQTKRSIEHDSIDRNGKPIPSILRAANAAGFPLDAGRYDIRDLSDGEDLALCVTELQQLTADVERWARRGSNFGVVVDFTGGTKCMSAAVSLQASRWPCVFSYVGGAQRTRDGVGVVEAGHERIVHQANPWDALGYRAIEDFIVLFNQHAFLAAANVATVALNRVSRPDRKRELAVLQQLANALDAWDRFEHSKSKNLLDNVTKSANDLRAVLGSASGERILSGATQLVAHLRELSSAAPPSRHYVLDLLANAKRRKDEGRFDDAVARLYRGIEAIAQVTLKEHHGIGSTEKAPVECIPETLRATWAARVNDSVVTLGLQEAYTLLAALNDPVGAKFHNAGLSGTTSPLGARNRSILAHGFERVSESVFTRLWSSALSLADIDEASLPSFPRIADTKSYP